MKKMFLALAVFGSVLGYAADPSVDDKIEKNFKAAFPKAEKVTWYENESYYEVLFTNNQVTCRLWYDINGNVTKTERYYKEEGLSPYLVAKLNKKFAGKKIFGVTEVVSDHGINYTIILEDEKKWYHVNADGTGNLQLDKKFIKA
jgi:hypothetical protein